MFNPFSHPPLSISRPLNRLESVFEASVHAGHVSSPAQVRGLIRSLELAGLGFGIDCPARDPDNIPESGLAMELILVVRRLTKVPEFMRAQLLEDMEEALAERVPVACMVHVVRSRLWNTDKVAWAQAMATVLFRVEDEETCKLLTAVISQHAAKPEAGVTA